MVSFQFLTKRVACLVTILLVFSLSKAALSRPIWESGFDVLSGRPERELEFLTKSKPNMYQIYVTGNAYFKTSALKEKISEHLGRAAASSKNFDLLRYQLKLMYRKSGFENVDIKVNYVHPKSILVKIVEGKQTLVDVVSVIGGNHLADTYLTKKVLQFIASGSGDWESGVSFDACELNEVLVGHKSKKTKCNVRISMDSTQIEKNWFPYDKAVFAEALTHLKNLYYRYGFLDVKVNGPQIVHSKQGYFVSVQYRIKEGEQIRIRQIKVNHSKQLKDSDLSLKLNLKRGDPLNGEAIEKERDKIREHYLNSGYPFVDVKADVEFIESKPEAIVAFDVHLDERISISEIEIQGAELTESTLIYHNFFLKPKEWFSLAAVLKSRASLYHTDLFNEVNIYLDPNPQEESGKRKLLVDLKEKKRTSIEVGMGLSLEDGPRIKGNVFRRNILGFGIGFQAKLQLNYPLFFYKVPLFYGPEFATVFEDRFNEYEAWMRPFLYIEGTLVTGLVYPNMLYFPFRTDGAIDCSLSREIKPAYNANKVNLQLGLSSKVNSTVRGFSNLEVEHAGFICPTGGIFGKGCGDRHVPSTYRLDSGLVNQISLNFSLFVDQRRTPTNPRKGYTLEVAPSVSFGKADLNSRRQQPSRLIAKVRPISYGKLNATLNTYLPVGQSLTWIFNLKIGGIFNFVEEGYVPLFKRFYLGGTNSVRGFLEDQILPADTNGLLSEEKISSGGRFILVVRNELAFPLFGELKGGVFFDVGELLEEIDNFDLMKVSMAVGFGLRYLTPIGPLLFDLGFRVLAGRQKLPSTFLESVNFHFSIGY